MKKTEKLKLRYYDASETHLIIEQALECANIQIEEGTDTKRFILAMGSLQIFLREFGIKLE